MIIRSIAFCITNANKKLQRGARLSAVIMSTSLAKSAFIIQDIHGVTRDLELPKLEDLGNLSLSP